MSDAQSGSEHVDCSCSGMRVDMDVDAVLELLMSLRETTNNRSMIGREATPVVPITTDTLGSMVDALASASMPVLAWCSITALRTASMPPSAWISLLTLE